MKDTKGMNGLAAAEIRKARTLLAEFERSSSTSYKSAVMTLGGIKFKSWWYSSGKQPKPMYITAMHRPNDGGLNFYFGYQTECATPEEIEFLYYFTGRVLFRSIENPDKTIKEIIDMT